MASAWGGFRGAGVSIFMTSSQQCFHWPVRRAHSSEAACFLPQTPHTQRSDCKSSQRERVNPALSLLTHVKEELPQCLHPCLQGFSALHLEAVCHLITPIPVADAEGERPLCGLLQLPCPDLSLLQGESRRLPSPLP